MLAFITGASSGIGRDMAKNLAKRGYNLILTARDEEKLLQVKNEILSEENLNTKVPNEKDGKNKKIDIKIIIANLENEKEVFGLYEKVKNEKIDIFINNAGFGTVGEFWKTDLDTEINMLKVNDLAMHILFKLILKDMLIDESQKNEQKSGNLHGESVRYEETTDNKTNDNLLNEKKSNEKYILNVASLSGFMPGPKMSGYYATKAYMLNLTRGVYKELKMAKSK